MYPETLDERPIAVLFTSLDLVAALQDSFMLVFMRYCPEVHARARQESARKGEHHHTVPGEYPTARGGVVQCCGIATTVAAS